MTLNSHDVLAAVAMVCLVILVVTGHLAASAVVSFVTGLVLRSPLDREVSEEDGAAE